MDGKALGKAVVAFKSAQNAYDSFKEADGFQQSDRAWAEFLVWTNRVFIRLRSGAKGYGRAGTWFRKIDKMRRNDPLLCYLHHARNVDEHRLEDIKTPVQCLTKSPDITEPCLFQPRITVRFSIEGNLLPVVDRGIVYDVPKHHLGKPLADPRPLPVAQLALSYLDSILNEAKNFLI